MSSVHNFFKAMSSFTEEPFLATLFTLYASKSPNPDWTAFAFAFYSLQYSKSWWESMQAFADATFHHWFKCQLAFLLSQKKEQRGGFEQLEERRHASFCRSHIPPAYMPTYISSFSKQGLFFFSLPYPTLLKKTRMSGDVGMLQQAK